MTVVLSCWVRFGPFWLLVVILFLLQTGELPYSYQLVSVVSHLGQSSVAGLSVRLCVVVDLSACFSVCLCLCLSHLLSVCLSVCSAASMSVTECFKWLYVHFSSSNARCLVYQGHVANPGPVARIKTGRVARPITDAADTTGLGMQHTPELAYATPLFFLFELSLCIVVYQKEPISLRLRLTEMAECYSVTCGKIVYVSGSENIGGYLNVDLFSVFLFPRSTRPMSQPHWSTCLVYYLTDIAQLLTYLIPSAVVTQFWYVGHYIADVYDVTTSRWLTCDDTSVAVTSEDSVRTLRASTGYIFFYQAKYVRSVWFSWWKTRK